MAPDADEPVDFCSILDTPYEPIPLPLLWEEIYRLTRERMAQKPSLKFLEALAELEAEGRLKDR